MLDESERVMILGENFTSTRKKAINLVCFDSIGNNYKCVMFNIFCASIYSSLVSENFAHVTMQDADLHVCRTRMVPLNGQATRNYNRIF